MRVTLRKKKKAKGRHGLYLDITGHGRHKEYLKLYLIDKPKDYLEKKHNEETMRQAQDLRAKRQLELQAQDHGLDYVAPSRKGFIEFFEEYIKNYAKQDVRKFEGAKAKYTAFLGTKQFFLNQNFVDRFKNYLSAEAGLKGETPVMYLSKFKRVCIAAYKERIIKSDPRELDWKMSFDRHALRKEVLSEAELRLLASTPCGNETVKRLFLFCCNTGLRFGDAKNLAWGDIRKWKIGIEQGKTGRFLHVELNSTAKRLAGAPGQFVRCIIG